VDNIKNVSFIMQNNFNVFTSDMFSWCCVKISVTFCPASAHMTAVSRQLWHQTLVNEPLCF
jgi:hypothetical protein